MTKRNIPAWSRELFWDLDMRSAASLLRDHEAKLLS